MLSSPYGETRAARMACAHSGDQEKNGDKLMKGVTKKSATAAGITVALVFCGLAQPAAALTDSSSTKFLPGYSARPPGQCWILQFATGQDLTSGYWAPCKSSSAGQAAQRREPAATSARAQASQRYRGAAATPAAAAPAGQCRARVRGGPCRQSARRTSAAPPARSPIHATAACRQAGP